MVGTGRMRSWCPNNCRGTQRCWSIGCARSYHRSEKGEGDLHSKKRSKATILMRLRTPMACLWKPRAWKDGHEDLMP